MTKSLRIFSRFMTVAPGHDNVTQCLGYLSCLHLFEIKSPPNVIVVILTSREIWARKWRAIKQNNISEANIQY